MIVEIFREIVKQRTQFSAFFI